MTIIGFALLLNVVVWAYIFWLRRERKDGE